MEPSEEANPPKKIPQKPLGNFQKKGSQEFNLGVQKKSSPPPHKRRFLS